MISGQGALCDKVVLVRFISRLPMGYLVEKVEEDSALHLTDAESMLLRKLISPPQNQNFHNLRFLSRHKISA